MSNLVVCRLKKDEDLWPLRPTGNWAEDNRVGREAAELLMTRINETQNTSILGHTAKAMGRLGGYNGTHVGFFNRVSERLITDAV